MKNQEQPFPVRGVSKKFEDWGGGWGVKKFLDCGVNDLGGITFAGVSVSHYIPCNRFLNHRFLKNKAIQIHWSVDF